MSQEIVTEVGKVSANLRELHNNADAAIRMLKMDLEETKEKMNEEGSATTKSLMQTKNMLPEKLVKTDEWKAWKADVEDYCEESFTGMKEALKLAKESDTEVDDLIMASTWWDKAKMLYRFLKKHAAPGSDAKKVITSVSKDNGWEAWRK